MWTFIWPSSVEGWVSVHLRARPRMNRRWDRVHAEISEMDPVRGDFRSRLVPGDWLCATRLLQGRCWLLPPSDNSGQAVLGPRIVDSDGMIIGPVLEVEHTRRFTSVLVEHPQNAGTWVWVNAWTDRNARGRHRGVSFCRLCRVDWWRDDGATMVGG